MPKTTAPLLSFGASGQIAKSMVFSTWKGVPYARRYAVPANPRTTKQVANRNIWQMLNNAYLFAPALVRAPFDAFAVGKALTGRNKFFSDNQKLFAVQPTPTELDGFVMSPGSGGGLPASNLVVTPSSGTLTLTATIPDEPSGWTITQAVGAALLQQAPDAEFSGKWFTGFDASDPYSVAITGLANGEDYVVGFWLEWERPDGKTAYSISLSGTGTPAP